jgi:hypothetical protein
MKTHLVIGAVLGSAIGLLAVLTEQAYEHFTGEELDISSIVSNKVSSILPMSDAQRFLMAMKNKDEETMCKILLSVYSDPVKLYEFNKSLEKELIKNGKTEKRQKKPYNI